MIADVGPAEDFPEARIAKVVVGGREIGIVRWGEKLFAVRNHCPHAEGPLCDGVVRSNVVGGPAFQIDLNTDQTQPVIVCPWHHLEFYLATGKGVRSRHRVQTYPVTTVGGRVLVTIGG